MIQRRKDRTTENQVVPLCIRISVQSGRQYLIAYVPRLDRISSFRTDNILRVRAGERSGQFDRYRRDFEKMKPHLWGISMPASADQPPEHIAFTVVYTEHEAYIHQRLEREKRCGSVEKLNENSSRFSAEVYDAQEMLPWIRTFICRISEFECSDRETETRFREDLQEMYRMYGLEGGGET